MIDAIILDKDQTLTDSLADFRVDQDLVATLKKLNLAGVKLFVVSGIAPNPSIPRDDLIKLELQRKISDLERSGLPSSLFNGIFVALPETVGRFATMEEFSQAKFQLMQKIISDYALDPKRVVSIGDDDEVEGAASERLDIKFIQVEPFCRSKNDDLTKLLNTLLASVELPELKRAHRKRSPLQASPRIISPRITKQ